MEVRSIMILLDIITNQCFAGITSQWNECGCRWEEWESWQECSRECNGRNYRTRKVRMYTTKKGCEFKFTTCASNDMGDDYSRCNVFCYNGGTADGYSCVCRPGFYGSCCGHQVTCGNPGSIANGRLQGARYTYDETVSYSCNANYILVGFSGRRRCNINGYWTGSKPRCAYFNSCSSSPCKNRGKCTNIPDDYKCTCAIGWAGRNCETDTLPPNVKNCPNNIERTTTQYRQEISWAEPDFSDPHGMFDVVTTRNYPNNTFLFPWGDFNVTYSAVKPSNGMKSKCVFQIKLRPNACPPLDIPENGAVVCNDWKTDYGMICRLFCKEFYTVARGVNPDDWFVCGSSGSWIPSNAMPNCTVWSLPPRKEYKVASLYGQCKGSKSNNMNNEMKKQFIAKLKQSHLRYFCEKFAPECIEENVSVRCN